MRVWSFAPVAVTLALTARSNPIGYGHDTASTDSQLDLTETGTADPEGTDTADISTEDVQASPDSDSDVAGSAVGGDSDPVYGQPSASTTCTGSASVSDTSSVKASATSNTVYAPPTTSSVKASTTSPPVYVPPTTGGVKTPPCTGSGALDTSSVKASVTVPPAYTPPATGNVKASEEPKPLYAAPAVYPPSGVNPSTGAVKAQPEEEECEEEEDDDCDETTTPAGTSAVKATQQYVPNPAPKPTDKVQVKASGAKSLVYVGSFVSLVSFLIL